MNIKAPSIPPISFLSLGVAVELALLIGNHLTAASFLDLRLIFSLLNCTTLNMWQTFFEMI